MKVTVYNILFAFVLLSCNEKPVIADEKDKETELTTQVEISRQGIKNAGITTGLAAMESAVRLLKVNGVVDVPPQSLVSVSFPMGGFLRSTDLLPGRPVRKGQVIGLMENQSYVDLQQEYLQSLSKLRLLNLDYQRQVELREGDASSKKNFETAKAEYEMQQVLVKSLSEKLLILGISPQNLTVEKISRTIPVRSPIDGFVKSVFVNVGKYVTPTDVLFEIVDPDHIHGSLVVFEKDQHLVKKGQKVKVYGVGLPDKLYHAEVILVSKDVDSNRGVTIHCHFLGDHSNLIPGMYISAEIATDSQMLPMLPESAVVRHNGKHYVFTVQAEGNYTMAEVTTGERLNGKVAITANYINWKNQEIVLTGAYALLGKLMNVEEE
jgi:cobalt-zinc-cadmium efflux system membrane fusion protein